MVVFDVLYRSEFTFNWFKTAIKILKRYIKFYRAQGLQTLFSLMGAQNMFEYHQGIKTGPEWSIARAQEILQNWERQFAKVCFRVSFCYFRK